MVRLKGYERFHLCRCKNCGFIFAKAIPTEDELIENYRNYGRADYESPITVKRYNEILDKLEPFRKTNRLIDVGCGIGFFLSVAKQRGWEVYGTEYTDEAVKICSAKGIEMKKGSLNPENYPPDFFDVVTSFQVIEHINTPKDEIKKFNQILRSGGVCYITTPNIKSVVHSYLGNQWNVICYPEHLSYFSPKTLAKTFRECGFKKKELLAQDISITRIKTSQKKIYGGYVNAKADDEKLRGRIESNKFLQFAKYSVNGVLSALGRGDTLKGYFVK